MKINHIYLLLGIFIIILLSSCLGGCYYREGLAVSERKDYQENKEDAMRQFKENNDIIEMMDPEDDVNNKNGLIGPGGEYQYYKKDNENEDRREEYKHRREHYEVDRRHHGIRRRDIPEGDENLYILKSQVVPPVCPACPPVISCSKDKEKCPPCPPCARCPEPAFECKKVPNYNTNDEDYLPRPVLNDFSQFGM